MRLHSLVILFASTCTALIPAWGYDYDEIVRISQAEQRVFGRVNTEQSLDERVRSVEGNLFGSSQGGSDASRVYRICQRLGIECPAPKAPQQALQQPVSRDPYSINRESRGFARKRHHNSLLQIASHMAPKHLETRPQQLTDQKTQNLPVKQTDPVAIQNTTVNSGTPLEQNKSISSIGGNTNNNAQDPKSELSNNNTDLSSSKSKPAIDSSSNLNDGSNSNGGQETKSTSSTTTPVGQTTNSSTQSDASLVNINAQEPKASQSNDGQNQQLIIIMVFAGIAAAFAGGAGLAYFIVKSQSNTADSSTPILKEASGAATNPAKIGADPVHSGQESGSNDKQLHFAQTPAFKYALIASSVISVIAIAIGAYFLMPSADNELRAAQGAYDKKDFDSALKHVDKALEFDQKRNDLHVMRGKILSSSGQSRDALQELNKVLGTEPLNTEALFYRANSLRQLQDYPKAIDDYQELLKRNEHVLDCYIWLGQLNCRMKDYQKSLAFNEKALQASPGNAMALWGIGQVYSATNDYQKAISYFNDAMKRDNSLPIFADRGYCFYKLGSNKDAIADLNKATDHNLSDSDSYNYMAMAKSALGNYADGINDLSKALNLDSFNDEYKTNMKQICEKLASQSRQKLSVRPRDPQAYANLAYALYNMKDFNNALDAAKAAISLDSSNYKNFSIAGDCQYEAEHFADAIGYYRTALSLNPRSNGVRFNLARAQSGAGFYRESIENYSYLIANNYSLWATYGNRGMVYELMFDYERAIADLQQSLKLAPYDARTYSWLGEVYSLAGQPDKAIENYKICIQIQPKMSSVYYSLSGEQLNKDNSDEALQTIERMKLVRSDYMSTQDYWSGLTHIYCMKGDYNKAADAVKKGLALEATPFDIGIEGLVNICRNDRAGVENDARALASKVNDLPPHYEQLMLYLLQRYLKQDTQAQQMIANTAARLPSDSWPAPVINFYAGKLTADELFQKYEHAPHIDPTELHAYIGFQAYFSGDLDTAKKHFVWVKTNGHRDYIEYILVMGLMRQNHWA